MVEHLSNGTTRAYTRKTVRLRGELVRTEPHGVMLYAVNVDALQERYPNIDFAGHGIYGDVCYVEASTGCVLDTLPEPDALPDARLMLLDELVFEGEAEEW